MSPPAIAMNGDNPAMIHVDETYSDLGATITGPQAALNLGIRTFLNGQLVSNIILDTSAVAIDTIDYVATDASGNTATTSTINATSTTQRGRVIAHSPFQTRATRHREQWNSSTSKVQFISNAA